MTTTLLLGQPAARSTLTRPRRPSIGCRITSESLTSLFRCVLYLYGDADAASRAISDAAGALADDPCLRSDDLVEELATLIYAGWLDRGEPSAAPGLFAEGGIAPAGAPVDEDRRLLIALTSLRPAERFAITLWSLIPLSAAAVRRAMRSGHRPWGDPLDRAIRGLVRTHGIRPFSTSTRTH